eukprot:579275_1
MSVTRSELLVDWFIRTHIEMYVPMEIKSVITAFSHPHLDSNMLSTSEQFALLQLLSESKVKHMDFELLYRASEHEFSALKFHELCDGMAPTVTIIETEFGNVFGGFTSVPWSSQTQWENDVDAFLFLLRSNEATQPCPQMFNCLRPSVAVRHCSSKGPCFGDGCDVNIVDKCDKRPFGHESYIYGNVSCCYNAKSGNCFSHKGRVLCGGNADKNASDDSMLFFIVVNYEIFHLK